MIMFFEEEPQVLIRKASKLSNLRNMNRKETFNSQITTYSLVEIICMNDYDIDAGKLLTNM